MSITIKSISIHGFRNLANVEALKLTSLNVLIGGNGTGKSTLLHFFEMLRCVSREDKFHEYVLSNGGGNDQCFMGGQVTPLIRATMVAATERGDYEYDLQLKYFPAGDRLSVEKSEWRVLTDAEHAEKLTAAEENDFLEQLEVFHFHDTSVHSAVNKYWDVADTYCLRPDGGNLAPVLLSLKQKDPLRYKYIVRQIQRVFPTLDDFVLKEEYGKVLLKWKNRYSDKTIGAYLTSDGTLRLFFLMTLLNMAEDRLPSVLMIDEPELGLHPHAVELVAAMIRRVSYSKQVLVATQSPQLVDAFDPENVIIASASQGAAQFERVPKKVYQRWLDEDYTLSDMWLSRPVGGVL